METADARLHVPAHKLDLEGRVIMGTHPAAALLPVCHILPHIQIIVLDESQDLLLDLVVQPSDSPLVEPRRRALFPRRGHDLVTFYVWFGYSFH